MNDERIKNITELVLKSHKIKITFDADLFHEDFSSIKQELEQHIENLKQDPDLEVTIIKVIDEIKVTVEIKND